MAIEETWIEPYIPAGGDVAIDVGANHGTWSALLAGRFRKVYAVEPNPVLVRALDDVAPNVFVVPMGAWDSNEWRDFGVYTLDVHTSAKFYDGGDGARPQPESTLRLPCMRLDELAITAKVDFIKVDVEAAEVEALRGADGLITHHRPKLIVEVHTAENGALVQQMMDAKNYRTTIVRHPYYSPSSPLYLMHGWMICEPG